MVQFPVNKRESFFHCSSLVTLDSRMLKMRVMDGREGRKAGPTEEGTLRLDGHFASSPSHP